MDTFNVNDVTGWVGFLAFGGGIYCLYASIMMKWKGVINEGILLNKENRFKKCKNKDAYIKELFPSFFTFAVLTTFCGAVDMINTFVTDIYILYLISLVLFIAGFFWFMATSKKCKDKYY